jgi:tol-pal system protein YbgF
VILCRRALLLPVAVLGLPLATGGCFATRQDVVTLQTDLQTVRAQQAHADSARQTQIALLSGSLARLADSVNALSARVVKWQGDVRGDLFNVQQGIIQIQELTGQSQRRLQELRAGLEARAPGVVPPPSPIAGDTTRTPTVMAGGGSTGATSNIISSTTGRPLSGSPAGSTASPAPGTPGPNELFQLALDQLRRGSTGAARAGFGDLLRQYPTADVAPDAQFYLAETYANEGNMAAADSGYQAVVAKYPTSARASTALYKHGVVLQAAGNVQAAKAAFQEVIAKYPRSDESVLAKDRLRALQQ